MAELPPALAALPREVQDIFVARANRAQRAANALVLAALQTAEWRDDAADLSELIPAEIEIALDGARSAHRAFVRRASEHGMTRDQIVTAWRCRMIASEAEMRGGWDPRWRDEQTRMLAEHVGGPAAIILIAVIADRPNLRDLT